MVRRILVVLGLVAGLGAAAAWGQTRPSADEITQAIKQLGDNDYSVRQKATDFLWRAGPAIEPALKAALNNPDGEVSARAQEILEKFKYGLLPDTPQEVTDLAREYRDAPKEKKRELAYKLVQMGHKADEVLRRLAASEESADIRNMILDTMAAGAGQRAGAAIAAGDPAAAEKILLDAMRYSYDSVRRDYAAYAMYAGKLDQVIVDLEKDPHTLRYGGDKQINLRLLAYCYRTKGDLAAAVATARRLNDDNLVAQLQFESCNWPFVLEHLNPEPGATNEQAVGVQLNRVGIGLVAADAKTVDAALAKLKELGAPPQILAQALLVSGHVPQAMEEYKAHQGDDPMEYCRLLQARHDYAGALAVAQQAIKDGIKEAKIMQLEVVNMWYWLGEDTKARELFQQARKEMEISADPRITVALLATARQIGLNDEAFEMAAQRCKAIEEGGAAPAPQDGVDVGTYIDTLFLEDGERQAYWYKVLRKMGNTPAAALATMRGMAERNLPEKDLHDAVEQATVTLGDMENGQEPAEEEKAQRAAYIGDTLYQFGKPAWTRGLLEKLAAKSKSPIPRLHLGDIAADQQDWVTAAREYAAAFKIDPAQPALLYLSGAALEQAGQDAAGRAAKDRADFIMLGEEMQRFSTALTLMQRGFAGDAIKQYELIVRTADFRSVVMNQALAVLQTRYADGGNYAGGLIMAQRSVADALSSQGNSMFSPNMLLGTPLPLYESRAQQAIAAGNLEAAQDALAAAAALAPIDMTVELGIIGQLDKSGHKEMADKAFNRLWDAMQQELKVYPNFPLVLNNLAWLCAKTGRHPVEGLAYAKKATALRPDEAQDLDTLADAQFINGQVKEAIATERKALELDPAEGFFREQIERFSKK